MVLRQHMFPVIAVQAKSRWLNRENTKITDENQSANNIWNSYDT